MDTLERVKKLFNDKIDVQVEDMKLEATLDSLGLDFAGQSGISLYPGGGISYLHR